MDIGVYTLGIFAFRGLPYELISFSNSASSAGENILYSSIAFMTSIFIISLKPRYVSEDLKSQIRGFVKRYFSPRIVPEEIEFQSRMPLTVTFALSPVKRGIEGWSKCHSPTGNSP